MKRTIEIAKECGMNGLVLGVLRKDRTVAVEHTQELVELAKPLPVTFHRAFDECRDLQQSLEEAIQTGATRVLTSGAAKSALDGVSMLRKLVHLTGNRAIIVPGAGISARNAAEVVRQTGARELHSGLSAALPYTCRDYRKFELEVQNLAHVLAEIS